METIVDLIFVCNGFIFGGYVRDMVAGIEPKDIDCSFPGGSKDREKFWLCLSRNFRDGFTVKHIVNRDYYNLQRLKVHTNSGDVSVDVCSEPFRHPDFDVNMLKMDDRETLSVASVFSMRKRASEYELSLQSIFRNIFQRKARVLSTCLPHRVSKMRWKGWEVY